MAMSFGGISKQKVATVIVAADGTGDTADIQAGINMLPAAGGVVYVKEGTYNLTSEISITSSNVALVGAGAATKLVTAGNVNTIKPNNVSNIHIEKIDVSGGGGGVPARAGINFLDTTRSIIQDCWVHDKANYGIILDSGNTNTITRCKVYDNGGPGIAGSHGEINSIILSNHVYGNAGYGILVVESRNLIRDNLVYQNTLEGIYVYNSSNNIIIGNEVTENDYLNSASRSGIYVYSDGVTESNRNVIMGNLCSENDNYEIEIANADCNKNLITGNNCYGVDHEGTILDNGTGTVVDNNIET